MSYQAFFEQTEAVAKVLQGYVERQSVDLFERVPPTRPGEEEFTAVWQAIELLSRAYTVLLPMVQFEGSKVALNIPDPVERKGTLYGPDGRAL